MRGKWGNKYNREDEFEFKVTKMSLLSELRDTMAKELIIKLDIDYLNGELVNSMFVAFNENQGGIPYRISVISRGEQMLVDMQSKRKGIRLTDGLIDFLMHEYRIQYEIVLKS